MRDKIIQAIYAYLKTKQDDEYLGDESFEEDHIVTYDGPLELEILADEILKVL